MKDKPEVVISLTSFPDRMAGLHLTVKSVLKQSVPADLVVIWLATSQFPGGMKDVPVELQELLSDKCQIRWCEDIRSYKKLVPSLLEFPNSIIITVDDDIIYERTLVEKLVRGYRDHPDCVIASRVTKFHVYNGVMFHDDGGSSYWKSPSYLNKLVGCAACLYPPRSLDAEVLNMRSAHSLAPTSDDIWFWLMAVKAGTKIYRIEDGDWLPAHNHVNSNLSALSSVNDGEGGYFYSHFDNVINAYPSIRERLLSTGIDDPVTRMLANMKPNCEETCTRHVSSNRTPQQFGDRNRLEHLMIGLKETSYSVRRWPFVNFLYSEYLNRKNRKFAYKRYFARLCSGTHSSE